MRGEKKPLYRKVNTRARGVFHNTGPDYRHARNTKGARQNPRLSAMTRGQERGLDYTPLYRFLLSRVGQPFDAVHAEALSRLDQEAPIWHIVTREGEERRPLVRCGESAFWTGLHVEDGILVVTDPTLSVEQLNPGCACCTHTLNGVRFTRPYEPDAPIRG